MVMKPYGMWNWITNKCSIPPSFPCLSFFFHQIPPTPVLPPSFPLSLPLSPVSLSSNKAAISNWNSMLSRSAHLIYKIKLKASHARMAFCSDEGKEEGTLSAAHNHLPVMWFASSLWWHLLPVTCYDVSNGTPKTLKLMYPGLWVPAFFSLCSAILKKCYGSLFNTCYKVAKHGYRFVPCHRHSDWYITAWTKKGPANYAL